MSVEVSVTISRKQITALFFCSLVTWSVGNGLIPLLPVYAKQLGANTAVSGYYLAFAYFAVTLGALSAGWVSDGFHRRKLPLIIAGFISVPIVWLMGQVHSVWGLMIGTALLWYCGGLNLALITILTGLSVGEKERGKIFGILALTMGLGGLIGGLGVGWLVDHWGYTIMFDILAVFMALLPLTALTLEEKEAKQPQVEKIPTQKLPGLGKSFYLLFSASILSSITGFFAMLIRSLVMSNLNFSPLEISSTGAIGGLMAMPIPLLMGWLSDRIGRKAFLFIGYFSAFASFVLLAFSRVLWNFWLVFVGQGIATGTTGVGNALVTDLVPRESLGRGLAIFGSAAWIGGMVGFTMAGYMLQNLGLMLTFLIGGFLALAAIILLIPIQTKSR
jgi:DHA1 family multidrug resistance protein-like MFS transporter